MKAGVETSSIMEVDLSEIHDYEDALTDPVWEWVKEISHFSHEENREDTRTYEFVVNLASYQTMLENGDEHEPVPDVLVDIFEHALENDVSYILFFHY